MLQAEPDTLHHRRKSPPEQQFSFRAQQHELRPVASLKKGCRVMDGTPLW